MHDDAKKALELIDAKKYVDAAKVIDKLVDTLPEALADCPKYKPDILFIKRWLKILTDEEKLQKALDENIPKNKEKLQRYRGWITGDWANGDYFWSGVDSAVLLQQSVGLPVGNLGDAVTDPKAVPDFVAGFLYGSTYDEHLADFGALEGCYSGPMDVQDKAHDGIKLVSEGKFDEGFAEISKLIDGLPKALESCENMDSAVEFTQAWLSILGKPDELKEAIEENWKVNQDKIARYLDFEQKDWANGDYYWAGVDTAVVLQKSIGLPSDLAEVRDIIGEMVKSAF